MNRPHRNNTANWEIFPVPGGGTERSLSRSLSTEEELRNVVGSMAFKDTGGKLDVALPTRRTFTLMIPRSATPTRQNRYNVTCQLYYSLDQCLDQMDERHHGLKTFMLGRKKQVLNYYKRKQGSYKPLHEHAEPQAESSARDATRPSGSSGSGGGAVARPDGGSGSGGGAVARPGGGSDGELEEDETAWRVCAPVLQVEGDNNAPSEFKNYVQMRLPHDAPVDRLGDVVVDCYWEDHSSGNKCHVKVPNMAHVLDKLPQAYFTIDDKFITIHSKHFCYYVCRLRHGTDLKLDAWIFSSYENRTEEKQEKVVIKVFLAETGQTKENMLQMLAPKLDARHLLWDAVTCQSVKLPSASLNEKGKASFYLALDDVEWRPYTIAGKPVQHLKQGAHLAHIVGCSQCVTSSGKPATNPCPPDSAVFDLRRKTAGAAARTFKGALYVTVKPFYPRAQGVLRKVTRALTRICVPEENTADGETEEGRTAIPLEFKLKEPSPCEQRQMSELTSAREFSVRLASAPPTASSGGETRTSTGTPPGGGTTNSSLNDFFLRKLCNMIIINEDNLYDYFFHLDPAFFNATRIKQMVIGSTSLQMAGFHLARGWHFARTISDAQKLDKLCAALEAVDKQGLEEKVRSLVGATTEQ